MISDLLAILGFIYIILSIILMLFYDTGFFVLFIAGFIIIFFAGLVGDYENELSKAVVRTK